MRMNGTNMIKVTACVIVGVILAGYVMNTGRDQYDFLKDASDGFDT